MKKKITAVLLVLCFAASLIFSTSADDRITLSVDFAGMTPTPEGETLSIADIEAYAAVNVKIAEFNSEGNILAAAENKKPSWVVYKLSAGEGSTFSSLVLKSFASVNDFLLAEVGAYAGNVFGIYVSDSDAFDFENGTPVISGMVGKMNHKWDLSKAAKGLETVYVAVYFLNNSDFVDWVRFYTFEFEGKTGAGGDETSDEATSVPKPPSIDYSVTVLSIDTALQKAPLTADPTKPEDAKAMKAYYAHNVVINDDGSRNCITPVNGLFTADYDLNPEKSYDGEKETIRYGAQPETMTLFNPYVCYRLCADREHTIDSLVLDMRYYLRKGNNCYYQIGIWVTDKFDVDDTGAYDFTSSDYACLLTSSNESDVNALGDKDTIDLSDAVKALNSREVFVIFLLNRGYGGEDATRVRIRELKLEATQSGGSAGGETDNSGSPAVTDGKTPGTTDRQSSETGVDPVAIILIAAGVLIAAVIVVTLISILKKKK